MTGKNNMDLRESINRLLENSESTYDYGCVMLYFTFPQMEDFHKMIKPEDIYVEEGDKTFGLEDELHCTLLYGLHEEVTLEDIKSVLDQYKFEGCKIFNPSKFDNEKYDVFKFDVMGGPLIEVNKKLTQFPHTNSYPDYHPHMTIGYLQPGTAKKYIDLFNKEGINEFNLNPTHCVYSFPDGSKEQIKIKKDEN
jgi:2'-5' RNA ligase